MNKYRTFHTAQNLLGAALLLSLLSTAAVVGLEGLANLLAVCENQCQHFFDSLCDVQPHRTVFPH